MLNRAVGLWNPNGAIAKHDKSCGWDPGYLQPSPHDGLVKTQPAGLLVIRQQLGLFQETIACQRAISEAASLERTE